MMSEREERREITREFRQERGARGESERSFWEGNMERCQTKLGLGGILDSSHVGVGDQWQSMVD